jgi:phage-related holin
MTSSSAIFLQGTFRTPATVLIMFSFLESVTGLLFMPVLEVAMFNEVFYHINKKCHEKIYSTLNSTH